jgi:hypothetical protein
MSDSEHNEEVTPTMKQMEEYDTLVSAYLEEAQKLFGNKTEYIFGGVSYNNSTPKVIVSDSCFLTGEKTYFIELNGNAVIDRKDGIFQLSHEVVHLLSPIEQDEEKGDLVNYLEEGMACYFSKIVTEKETADLEYCELQFEKHEKYKKAYELFVSLLQIDKDAVKKLRVVTEVISHIKPGDFETVGLKIDQELINALLSKF